MGRIVPQRRPVATARVLASVADIATVGWIGGPGPDERFEYEVRALGVPVTGWLDRDEAVDRLSRSTVLLNWSAWEGRPLGVLEAMAYDVLVIASDIEANRELVGPEQVCASEEQATRLLRDLLADPSRLAERLHAQRERGRRFGASRMGRDWLRVYERLAARQADAPPTPAKHAGAGRLTS